MDYEQAFLSPADSGRAAHPLFQHLLDTYVSESNKTAAVWSELRDQDLAFRLHPRSMSIREHLSHQLLSERRFFAEFIGLSEPAAAAVLPSGEGAGVVAFRERYLELARARLAELAPRDQAFWLEPVPFFDVRRERIWVFWRRLLHSAHHRAQVGVALRLIGSSVPATYGPSADVTWSGADPTQTVAAAERRSPPAGPGM